MLLPGVLFFGHNIGVFIVVRHSRVFACIFVTAVSPALAFH
jgi:hypothetical protein